MLTNYEKNIKVAAEIMGWDTGSWRGGDWNDERMQDWDPCTRWDHAGMVLNKMVKEGSRPALIYDDNGHWTLALEGMQNVPLGEGPEDIATTFFIEAGNWHDTPQIAIVEAALAT